MGFGTNKDKKKAGSYFSTTYYENSHILSVHTIFSLKYDVSPREKSAILEIIDENEKILNRIKDVQELFELGIAFFDVMLHIQIRENHTSYKHTTNSFEKIPMKEDRSRAFKCLKVAAGGMHPGAMVRLGIMYFCSYGVAKNSEVGDIYLSGQVNKEFKFVERIATLYHTHEDMQNLNKAFE